MADISTRRFANVQAQGPTTQITALVRFATGLATLAERAIAGINQRRAAYVATDIPARIRRDIGLA